MPKLFIVINNTDQQFQFVNTECSNDNKTIKPGTNYTEGQYGEGCDIPDCSGQKYFDGHHMSFNDMNGNSIYWFWNNDDKNHLCYYTKQGNFDSGDVIPGEPQNDGCQKAIIINSDNTLQIGNVEETPQKEDSTGKKVVKGLIKVGEAVIPFLL